MKAGRGDMRRKHLWMRGKRDLGLYYQPRSRTQGMKYDRNFGSLWQDGGHSMMMKKVQYYLDLRFTPQTITDFRKMGLVECGQEQAREEADNFGESYRDCEDTAR